MQSEDNAPSALGRTSGAETARLGRGSDNPDAELIQRLRLIASWRMLDGGDGGDIRAVLLEAANRLTALGALAADEDSGVATLRAGLMSLRERNLAVAIAALRNSDARIDLILGADCPPDNGRTLDEGAELARPALVLGGTETFLRSLSQGIPVVLVVSQSGPPRWPTE